MGNREPHVRLSRLSHCLMLSLAVAAAGALPHAHGHAQSRSSTAAMVDFDIPAGELSVALDRFAEQSGLQVVSEQPLLQDVKVQAVRGRYAAEDALGRLLSGSGFGYQRINAQTLVLRKQAVAPAPRPETRSPPAGRPQAQDEAQELSGITVTGTRIRGGSTPSPVITIGAERIREEGFNDLGEVIRSLPQNFNGGQNPGVAAGGSSAGGITNQNFTGGSSLNLRGLGPDATLTLLNGRRLSYGGFVQAVDISAIPVEAVERIEIVADGASAIYGSDAVGGVGNVILKRDHDGVTVGWRYGGASDGGLRTREYHLTAGTTWSSGGLIATYKDVSADPIYARARSYTDHLAAPTTIYPGSDLRSGLLSVHQSLGGSAEFRLDAFRTQRDQEYYYWYAGLPTLYAKLAPQTTSALVSPSLDIFLPNDWTLSIGATRGEDEHIQRNFDVVVASGQPTLYIDACHCNQSRSYEVGAEGPMFPLPGGDARLAVGVGYRLNDYGQLDRISGATTVQGDEASRFAYAEINLPLLGPESNVAGVRRLAATAAVRGEDYDSFGSVTTPKLGLIYGPNDSATFKASWGKSFKSPTLRQRYSDANLILYSATAFGGADYPSGASVLSTWGGSQDLQAERATAWTASMAFHPRSLDGLEAELTWFDIDYTDRVVAPISDFSGALGNQDYVEFVELNPAASRQAEVVASYPALYNYTGSAYDPDDVVAIIFAHNVNVARQRIRGLDLSGAYRFDFAAGRLAVRGSVSYLDISQQNSETGSSYDVAGTLFNPARVNGRVGAVWSQGGFAASAFVNHTGGVSDAVNDEKLASFTTFDATLRYATDPRNGAFSGLELALSAQNLFNRDPPLYRAVLDRLPYDSTNYSAIGRFLLFSVSKHW